MIPPATFASTEATQPTNPQLKALPSDYAIALTDHQSHEEQNTAIGAYIRWHNQRARPKTECATKSKIRHPDYPFKAA